jgi:hypothetical protein
LHCGRGLHRALPRDPADAAILLSTGYLISPIGEC